MSGAKPQNRSGSRVLLVDDDPSLLRLITLRLESSGFTVDAVSSADAALGLIEANLPDALVTDLKMDGMDGMALFRSVRARNPALPVIIMTAHGTIPDAVQATREGVFAFLAKPFRSSELVATVREAISYSCGASGSDLSEFGIVTRSPAVKRLLQDVRLVAESGASVLILGESGTGKELIARALHQASERASKPFVAINCAAMPADLLEAELFGHTRGAFTGAERARDGLFLQAQDGSLFLDEIGDMPLSFQAKLLRVVQERCIRPIGADHESEIDVRLISATHLDLDQAARRGDFREDLYYRLNVVTLEVPALRERPEDIPLLAEHFLAEFGQDLPEHRHQPELSSEAVRALVEHDWPGNVRELRNVIEQLVALCRTELIAADLVQRALRSVPAKVTTLADARADFERDYLARVLRMAEGNVSQAADLAGRNRTEFYRLLKRHHLEPARFKPSEET